MALIFITGSSDGLGLLTAKSLVEKGYQVVLHARDEKRKLDTLGKLKGTIDIVTGDLSDVDQTKKLAQKVNALGKFETVIHNAGVYNASAEDIFKVNVLAPYILSCLIQRPKRLIYVSSGMHEQGRTDIDFSEKGIKRITYSDSKFYVLLLSFAISRRWSNVYSNTVDPGWVPTKMGGSGATDSLQKGYETQVWLATDNNNAAVSGHYFYHKEESNYKPEANNIVFQEELLKACSKLSGISFPQ